ncbi:hypothetical protein FACS18942_09960 [Planctomycetales bacterium]|nr:hypothetical protein FACS18942_09960 [Planctomycetales bacterium]
MNRTFFFAVITFFTVVLSSAVSFAENIGNAAPQKIGKDFYRTQYKGGFVMPQPVIVPQPEYNTGRQPLVVAPHLEEAAVPQNNFNRSSRIPAPPEVPNRTEQPEFAADIFLPGETVIIPNSETVVSDRIIDERPVSQGIDEKALQHPLSGIDLPKKPDNSKSDNVKSLENNMWTFADTAKKDTTAAAVLPVPLVPKAITVPAGIAEQKQQLDDFNSRLAKIQLEKKNLTAVLSLIEKIKSPEFKVKTLVDLAEYVSRDSNYKKEADTLYELAVSGIDALSTGKPVVVLDTAKNDAVKTDTIKLPEKPVIKPETNTESKPEVKPVVPKKPLTLVDEAEEPLPKFAPKPAETKPVEEPKPAETKSAETKSDSKKKLTLIDEAEEPLPKLAPKPAETKPVEEPKPAETKSAETKSDSKKKLTLVDEAEEPLPKLAPKPAETKSAQEKPAEVKNTETKSVEELKPAESKQPAAAPDAPVRKPLPKRKIVVTD